MRKAEEKNGVGKHHRLPSTCDLQSRRPEKYRRNYGQLEYVIICRLRVIKSSKSYRGAVQINFATEVPWDGCIKV